MFRPRRAIGDAAAEGGFVDVIMLGYNPVIADKADKLNRAIDACAKAGIGLIAMKTNAIGAILNCPKCGRENAPGVRFCGYCGADMAPTPTTCPRCQASNAPGMKFCGQCGYPFTQGPNDATLVTAAKPPTSPTPPSSAS